jgi:hypothetical protein
MPPQSHQSHAVLSRVIPESSRQSPEPSRNNEQYDVARFEQLITRCPRCRPLVDEGWKDKPRDDGEGVRGGTGRHGNWGDGERRDRRPRNVGDER